MITVANLCEYLKIIAPAWVTSTSYTQGQYVTSSSVVYVCLVVHTSGTFTTDLAAGNWRAMSILTTAINTGISFVENYCNRGFSASSETSATEYFNGDGSEIFIAKNYPVTDVTSIKYFDEDTSTWITMFEGSDSIADSVMWNETDYRIVLYNGYFFSLNKKYEIVYKYTITAPQIIKMVALEQAARYWLNSFEGQQYFSKTSENIGSQANESLALESQDALNARHYSVLDGFRNWNV